MRSAAPASRSRVSACAATLDGMNSSCISSGTILPAGDEIRHRKRVDLYERPAEPVGQRRQPVDHDHRTLVQRRLDRHRSRGDEGHVSRREHGVGLAFDHRRSAGRCRPRRANSSSARCGARAITNCAPARLAVDDRRGLASCPAESRAPRWPGCRAGARRLAARDRARSAEGSRRAAQAGRQRPAADGRPIQQGYRHPR